jgi:hypothetical protein
MEKKGGLNGRLHFMAYTYMHASPDSLLTLPLHGVYYYSATSHASCPARVALFPIFISLLKKCIRDIGFRFIPLDSLVFVVSVTVQLPSSPVGVCAGLSQGSACATSCFDI